jgi:GGDEF domain-containing protein
VDDAEQLLTLAERISLAIAEPIGAPSGCLRVTASIGAAVAETGESPDHLLNRADRAMYQAKSLGRSGRCVLAGKQDHEQSPLRK